MVISNSTMQLIKPWGLRESQRSNPFFFICLYSKLKFRRKKNYSRGAASGGGGTGSACRALGGVGGFR